MKLSCLQENLAKGISIVSRVVSTRAVLPVLSNILMATDEGRLKLAATDLSTSITCWIGAKVEEDGAITIPARLLSDFVSTLPPAQIQMELVTRTKSLHLKCAQFEADIHGIDAQDFPLIPTDVSDHKIEILPAALRQMIEQVTLAAAPAEEGRLVLTGALAEFQDSQLTMVAADGFRLSLRRAQLSEEVSEPLDVIIPARALRELARVSVEEEDPVQIIVTPNRNQVLFRLSNVEIISQLIEGKFPDYNQIIPSSYGTRVVVNTHDLMRAVRISVLFSRDVANIVRLEVIPGSELTPGRLRVESTAEVGQNVGDLDASVEGEQMEIAFNGRYLIDMLNVIGTEQVVLEATNPSRPGILKPVGDDNLIYVIMPMHIKK
ncbi:MAG: DNA polymerase III subunit beta [Anaerolineae bacterium]